MVTFTGDATKAFAVYMKQGTSNDSVFGLFDATAGLWKHRVDVTWSGGVPTLATGIGGGTLFTPVAISGGWYRLSASANSIVAANSNRFYLYPTQDAAGDTGT